MDKAAEDAGIPFEEVLTYISDQLRMVDPLNMQLRLMGMRGLKQGLTKLGKLARDSTREGKDFESTDLLAARELCRTALIAIKMSKEGQGAKMLGGSTQGDLFDQPENPWKTKEIS